MTNDLFIDVETPFDHKKTKIPHFEKIKIRSVKRIKAFVKHILICGGSGSGKSNTAESIATQKVGKGKVIDLVDRGRFENMTYGSPENKPELVEKISYLTGGRLEAQGFENDIYLVSGQRTRYFNTLPNNVKVVRLDMEDITLDLLHDILAENDTQQSALSHIKYTTKKDMTLNELEIYLKTTNEINSAVKMALLVRIGEWKESGMFDKRYPLLDINAILNDKDKITSFSTYFVQNAQQEAIFYTLLLKKILEAKRRRQIPHEVTTIIREIHFFMRKKTQRMKSAKQLVEDILREGRDLGVTLIADTQLFDDLDSNLSSQFGTYIFLRSPYKQINAIESVAPEVPRHILNKIPYLERGRGYIISGGRYYYPVFYPPARNWHKEENTDVFAILKKKYGYYSVSKKYPEINEEVQNGQSNRDERIFAA